MDPQPRGPDWMQITPKAGFLFHANSHPDNPPHLGAKAKKPSINMGLGNYSRSYSVRPYKPRRHRVIYAGSGQKPDASINATATAF